MNSDVRNEEMVQSSLDYNPFYQTKFKNIKHKPSKHNSNALLLLSKINSDPSTYLSNQVINNFIKNQPNKNIQLTNKELKEQAKIARDFV
jgi:hypothetical protein